MQSLLYSDTPLVLLVPNYAKLFYRCGSSNSLDGPETKRPGSGLNR